MGERRGEMPIKAAGSLTIEMNATSFSGDLWSQLLTNMCVINIYSVDTVCT